MYFNRFTQRAKTAIDLGVESAKSFGHKIVGTEHLLLGLLKENDGIAAKVLNRLGVTEDILENKILSVRLDDEDKFPSELNGLIAMQLSQKYKRPTIVARLNPQGYVRGSIRGLSNSELSSFKDYLDSTGLFEYVQGHDNAAGCSIKNNDLDELHRRANTDLAQYDFGEDYYEVNFERQAFNDDLSNLTSTISTYRSSSKDVNLYTVDMNNGLNKGFAGETSNKEATKASELSISGPTVIKFSNNKISTYIEGTDEVIKYLES